MRLPIGPVVLAGPDPDPIPLCITLSPANPCFSMLLQEVSGVGSREFFICHSHYLSHRYIYYYNNRLCVYYLAYYSSLEIFHSLIE